MCAQKRTSNFTKLGGKNAIQANAFRSTLLQTISAGLTYIETMAEPGLKADLEHNESRQAALWKSASPDCNCALIKLVFQLKRNDYLA